MEKHFYITTPIYYPNSVPHIGSVYTTLCCDMIARFKKLDGYTVKFLTGTDEHGQKIEKAAEDNHETPQEFVDTLSASFRKVLEVYNFSCSDFIRTTEDRHKKGALAFWKTLEDKGHIYLANYAGWYSVRDESFYTETDLVDGKAPTGAPVEWVEEPSYFFNLSAWQEKLLEFYDQNPDFIAPASRRNEVISFVKGGLKDLSVSRTSFSWGIPLPSHPDHIMYVWLDALSNYITALGYPDTQTSDYKNFWPADVHMVGKDILRFHAVYWPAFLMAAGLPLPKRIFAHGWWTNRGDKISKSLGNTIDPFDLADRFGVDPVRYFLLREIPFGNDGDYSEQALIQRINSQLSNEFGNLAQRTLSMAWKNCDARIPTLTKKLEKIDEDLLNQAYQMLPELRSFIDQQAIHKYADLVWTLVTQANKYVDEQAPWALAKTDPERMEVVLYAVAELLRCLAILLQPMIPESAGKLLDYLSVPQNERDLTFLSAAYAVKQGITLTKPEPLFPRIITSI
ncbi:MAG: methionine--tRNA ligase [Alphaproteobacteria bacterium]